MVVRRLLEIDAIAEKLALELFDENLPA